MSRERSTQALLEADAAARRAAQTEFERPLVLEAGAGTGKTFTLVARILAWSLGPGWERAAAELSGDGDEPDPDRVAARVLEGVVAITFTEAAAAEMASRIAELLAQLAAGRREELERFDPATAPRTLERERRRRRARALLGALDHLTVRTIHSYCRHLLARFPLEAGLHPDLRVDADGSLLEEIVRQVVDSRVREAYAAGARSPLVELAARGNGPRSVAEAVQTLAQRGFRSALLDPDPFDRPHVERMIGRLHDLLERFRAAAAGRLLAIRRGSIAARVARAVQETADFAAAIAAPDLEGAAALCSFLARRWSGELKRLREWERGRFLKSEAAALGDRAERLSPLAGELYRTIRHHARIDPPLLDSARRALRPLLAEVEEQMRSRGVITFDGLLQEARRLLEQQPRARAREQARLDQLLVDEFQDTDRVQCELVRLLALSGPAERRPGLFVVGDPKQSIYGWRNADLEAYHGFLATAAQAGAVTHSMAVNFRSARPILQEVDRSLGPVMAYREGIQPRYERLLPCEALQQHRGCAEGKWAPIEFWISWRTAAEPGDHTGPDTLAPDAAEIEARAVARDIVEVHDELEIPWSEFGILLRATGRLDTYLDALRDAGVPFTVSRDKSYYRRREVIEAAALIRAIVHPVDHIALLAFLRSASVGVPDAALLPLWRRGFPRRVTELEAPSRRRLEALSRLVAEAAREIPASIPGLERVRGWEQSLVAALESLALLRQSFRDDPPDRFLERLRRRLLIEAGEAARYQGRFRLANLERLFRQVRVAFEARGADVQAILRTLRRAVAEAQEAAEALPKEGAENAVRVFTIHSAKGLEFRHVYLVQLHGLPGGEELRRADSDERWGPGAEAPYRLFGSPTPDFDLVERRRESVAAAERVRTLYVALTRARERLVLAGCWPRRIEPRSEPEIATHLDLLLARQPPPPETAGLLEAAREPPHYVDAAGVRWKFPALEEGEPRAATAAVELRSLPSVAAVEAASRLLIGHAEKARVRMARPFRKAATEDSAAKLEELLQNDGGSERGAQRATAQAIGTAFHRLFETWELEADPAQELERQRAALEARLATLLAPETLAPARERARALFERLESGRLLRHFLDLRERIVGREVPILMAPEAGMEGPVGFLSGAVDLIYREEREGRLVIVDFKTDEVAGEEEIKARAAAYEPQEAIYARALETALKLPYPPRCELWFLAADLVWTRAEGGSG